MIIITKATKSKSKKQFLIWSQNWLLPCSRVGTGFFSATDITRQKINKEIEDSSNTVNQLDWTDICNPPSNSRIHTPFKPIWNMLQDRLYTMDETSLSRGKTTEIIQSMFSNCSWNSSSYTPVLNWFLETVLGKVEKKRFIALPGKGGHNKLIPSNCLSQPEEGSEKFYQRGGHDQLVDILLTGWW